MNVGSDEDYYHIVSEMYDRNLMGGILADDVFKDQNGVGVFNGAFVFGEKKKANLWRARYGARDLSSTWCPTTLTSVL